MKTFLTVPVRVTTHPRLVQWNVSSKRSLPRRFERFTESSEWDDGQIYTQWIDKICLASIVISVFYFIPMLARFILE